MNVIKVIFSITLFFVLFGLNSEAKKRVEYKYDISENTAIDIYSRSGSVNIKSWKRDYVSIKATMVSWSWKGEKELESVRVEVKKDTVAGVLAISSVYIELDNTVNVYYDIAIPYSGRLRNVEILEGDINVDGVRGDISLESSNGRIKLQDVSADITISTTNGAVELDSCLGNNRIKTTNAKIKIIDSLGDNYIENSNGRVEVINVAGNVKIDSRGGGVKVVDSTGRIEISSTFGKIDVLDCIGDVSARVDFGKVRMQNLDGYLDVVTGNGDIEILQTKGIIRAETGNGDIEAELYNIKVDDGVRFKTNNGDIELHLHYNLDADVKIYKPRGRLKIYDVEIEFEENNNKKRLLEGRMGNGGAELYIESQNGDIKLYEL